MELVEQVYLKDWTPMDKYWQLVETVVKQQNVLTSRTASSIRVQYYIVTKTSPVFWSEDDKVLFVELVDQVFLNEETPSDKFWQLVESVVKSKNVLTSRTTVSMTVQYSKVLVISLRIIYPRTSSSRFLRLKRQRKRSWDTCVSNGFRQFPQWYRKDTPMTPSLDL